MLLNGGGSAATLMRLLCSLAQASGGDDDSFGGRDLHMAKKKTPQEKKVDAYEKERRNTYGERGSHSRHAVARAKQTRAGRARAAARQAVAAMRRDPALADRLEGRAVVTRGGRWQKVPDKPLGEVLERKFKRRARSGSMPDDVVEAKVSRIRRRT
jgi:hypothetical protein